MGARLLAAVGALSLVVALALLIVTCASIPNTSLPIFTVDASSRFSSNFQPQIRVHFGLWGWCQLTTEPRVLFPEGCVRVNGTSGYDPALVMRPLNSDFPPTFKPGGMRDMTLGFVLPAVATATNGAAIILLVAAFVRRNRICNLVSIALSVLSLIFTIAAVGCVFAFCEKVRRGTPSYSGVRSSSRTQPGYDYQLKTYYGPCVVTLALACGVLLVATITLFFAWLASKREGRRTWSEDGTEKHRVSHSEVAPSGSTH
ncbi:hypothetical protein CGCF415_v013087 [Colletotrichum fructicola]|nr:hypothetical protein CGCF415_v013087 [Colletotrichum fructicola]KAF4927502.1 hypothetical protein CGCF245_v013145 [Colletotrichum fructicola]